MKAPSKFKRILLGMVMIASTSFAFAATTGFTVDAITNSTSSVSETYALLLAGLGLMATIARRRNGKQG